MARVYKKKWMPVCIQDRDTLIYYLYVLNEELVSFGLVDSLAYSDILPSGDDITKCSDEIVKDNLYWFCRPYRFTDEHPENLPDEEQPCMELICPECSYPSVFVELCEIPHNNYDCPCCGRPLIEYFGAREYKPIKNDLRMKRISEEFEKMIAECGIDKLDEGEDDED